MMTTEMTTPGTAADADLVNRTLAGQREAFEQIVSRYQTLICSLAYSATGSLGQSEDLAQETFITAWKHLGHLREPGKLRAWLCGVARNRINNYLRREGKRPLRRSEPLEVVQECPAPGPLPAENAMKHEEQALLWRVLEKVPETYREPLVLFYREHQSVERVAAELELSEEAVKQRLARGRKLLQEGMLAFIEGALEKTTPGKAFTLSVLAALPLLTSSATAATLGATAAKTAAAAKALAWAGLAGAILGPLVGLFGGILGTKVSIANTESTRERRFMVRMAWLTWLLVIVFCAATLGYTLLLRNYWKSHPVLITWLSVGMGLGYCLALLTLILWGNRNQRRIRAEEAARLPAGIAPPARRYYTEPFEYRSRATFLGLPLVHIRMECKQDGKALPAKGWIAFGNIAYGGLFACAGVAVAPISVGGLAIGLLSIGGCALGLLSFAGMALGIWAMGGAAVGYAAYGGSAIAWLAAQGGCAVAHQFAQGGAAFAAHANDPLAQALFQRSTFFAQGTKVMEGASLLVCLPLGLLVWQALRLRRRPGV